MNLQAVRFQQEANFLFLSNPLLSLRFSLRPPGSLVSLSSERLGGEFLDSRLALAVAETWRIELPQDSSLPPLGSRRAQEFSHRFSLQEEGAGRLEMEWRNFTSPGGQIAASVGLALTLPADSSLCSCRIWVQLPPELVGSARGPGLSLLFPNLTALRLSDAEAAGLFLPSGEGLLIPRPQANLPTRAEWLYPGELTMQFAGLQISSPRASLYLAAHDSRASIKGFRAGLEEQSGLTLSFLNFLTLDAEGNAEIAYELAFGLLAGDWVEACQAYREWAWEQAWWGFARDDGGGPVLSDRQVSKETAPAEWEEAPSQKAKQFSMSRRREGKYRGLWLVGRGTARQVVPAVLGLQREGNAPVRLLWQWWHGCPGDSRYPDYLPPRDGEEAFSGSLSLLREAEIPAWLGVDGVMVSPRARGWETFNLEAHASLNAAGSPQGVRENPFADDGLVAMCPADGGWPALLRDICNELRKLGAEGVWLQRLIPPPQGGLRCYSQSHPHPPGAGDYLADSLAVLSPPLVISDPSETHLALLEAAIFSGPSRERAGRPKGIRSDDWEPLPLLQAVYSPGLEGVGLIGPLNNLFPHDPLWPTPPPRLRAAEASLLRGDYSLQFFLEGARTLLWGYQPALVDFDPFWLRENVNVKKLAFLRTLLQVNATEPALARGELLGAVASECEGVEVDFLVNSLYSLPGQRRAFARLLPAVLATAWRGDRGRLLVIFVNLLEKEAEFACNLPLSRFGIPPPRRVYGLTFSPELGGKAAHLALAEGEISGRLPARSASIVWL